jgi:hypothetical protein
VKATLNESATGYYRDAAGLPVTVLSRTANRRAVTVRLEADYRDCAKGKRVQVPSRWVREEEG